jgi:hypothetical protein
LDDLEHQLRRWRLVHDHARKAGKHIAWLDLSVSNNVPAHLVDATFLPPPAQRTQKPPRYRKKHV